MLSASENNQYRAVVDQSGELMADDQIISGLGTSDNSVNAETLHRNWYGSYLGDNNPKDYKNKDSYQYVPTDKLDYDREKVSGASGVANPTKGYLADKLFASRARSIAFTK